MGQQLFAEINYKLNALTLNYTKAKLNEKNKFINLHKKEYKIVHLELKLMLLLTLNEI